MHLLSCRTYNYSSNLRTTTQRVRLRPTKKKRKKRGANQLVSRENPHRTHTYRIYFEACRHDDSSSALTGLSSIRQSYLIVLVFVDLAVDRGLRVCPPILGHSVFSKWTTNR